MVQCGSKVLKIDIINSQELDELKKDMPHFNLNYGSGSPLKN